MSEIGTLKELNVKPGDVVEHTMLKKEYTVAPNECLIHPGGMALYYPYFDTGINFRIVSRAADTHKLWRDMTDAEKGAMMLAHHEGKAIELFVGVIGWQPCKMPYWLHDTAYRIRPEPKRVTVPLMADNKNIGTIDLVDGEPDQSSIKMGEA